MDGLLGYNQVLVSLDNRKKTTFITPRGTYKYIQMSFDMLNVGGTFQRVMDYAFRDLIKNIIEIYQDDLIFFSVNKSDHIIHLKKVFEICRKYGISINPKKIVLGVT